jgi:hypothetical protein
VASLAGLERMPPVSPVCRTRFAILTDVDQAFQDHHLVSGQALPGQAM